MKRLHKIWSFLLSLGGMILCSQTSIAAPIAFGQTLAGSIAELHQTNVYSFAAASNDVLYLTLVRTNGSGTAAVYLLGPDRAVVASAGQSSSLAYLPNLRLNQSGNYAVEVVDNNLTGPFDYLLTLNRVGCGVNRREPGDGPEILAPGESSHGNIGASDYDTFCFAAASNDVIYLTTVVTNGPGNGPSLYLYDPDGVVVTTGISSSYFAYTGNLRLTKTGSYTVGVIDGGLNESFDYLITFNQIACGENEREAGDGPESLAPGRSSYGQIGPADYDSFCFSAASNDVIYLTLLATNGPGSGPALYLYDPDGVLVTTGINSSYFTYVGNLRLTKTGTYIVGVIDGGLNESFDYLITFNQVACGKNEREAGDGPESVATGRSSYGQIGPADYDTFCFSAASNDVIYLTLLVTNGPGSGPGLYLYDPDGDLVTSGINSSSYAFVRELRLTKTGTYIVGVIDGGLNESFDYAISVIGVPGPNVPDPGDGAFLLGPGESRSSRLTPGDLDAYSVKTIAGDTLILSLRIVAGTGRNPELLIFDPGGTLLASASGLTRARIRLPCVHQTGAFTVVVFDDGLNEDFDYELTLEQSPVAPSSNGFTQYLAICDCTNRVVVRWETGAEPLGFRLESSLSADETGWPEWMESPEWGAVSGPFNVIGNHFYFAEPPTNGTKFYRLKVAP